MTRYGSELTISVRLSRRTFVYLHIGMLTYVYENGRNLRVISQEFLGHRPEEFPKKFKGIPGNLQ